MRVRTLQPINKFHRVDDNCPNIGDCRASKKVNKLLPKQPACNHHNIGRLNVFDNTPEKYCLSVVQAFGHK